VSGRKTDIKDCEWIADLLRHGLLRASFVPDRAQRELRELTRYRTGLVRERARVVQRPEKVLEGANIKLGAVVTELLGVSGQRMLDAAVQGMTDPDELVGLAHAKLQPKRDLLIEALQGQLTRPLHFLIEQHLAHWRELDARVAAYDAEIAEQLRPFDELVVRLGAIPGVGQRTAEVIVAEIGVDVAAFPSPGRLAARRGRRRAIVALAHTLVVDIYFMLARGTDYADLGARYFDLRDRDRTERRILATLRNLVYDVTVSSRPAPNPEAA
jgi:transposase